MAIVVTLSSFHPPGCARTPCAPPARSGSPIRPGRRRIPGGAGTCSSCRSTRDQARPARSRIDSPVRSTGLRLGAHLVSRFSAGTVAPGMLRRAQHVLSTAGRQRRRRHRHCRRRRTRGPPCEPCPGQEPVLFRTFGVEVLATDLRVGADAIQVDDVDEVAAPVRGTGEGPAPYGYTTLPTPLPAQSFGTSPWETAKPTSIP